MGAPKSSHHRAEDLGFATSTWWALKVVGVIRACTGDCFVSPVDRATLALRTFMANYMHIAVVRSEVIRALIEEAQGQTSSIDAAKFVELTELLLAVYHFELHKRLEGMKRDYAPFNPDLDSVVIGDRSQSEITRATKRLSQSVRQVLKRGNYHCLDQAEILRAFTEKSLFPVKVEVNLHSFSEFLVYARGESMRTETIATWFGLWKKKVEVPAYDRVCLYIHCKEEADIPVKMRRRLKIDHQPGMIMLKLFRNIPKHDLEMLFPSYEVLMRTIDKLMLGIPALAAGVPVVTKLGPALLALGVAMGVAEGRATQASLVTGLTGLVMLGAYLFTQWTRFQFQKVLFMKVLSENLYFRNLDNNEGVLTRLVDDAEEEECKEALLAYYFLLQNGHELESEALDRKIEQWLRDKFNVDTDFDVDDALSKLQDLGLGLATKEAIWRATPLEDAIAGLHRRWDDCFRTDSEKLLNEGSTA